MKTTGIWLLLLAALVRGVFAQDGANQRLGKRFVIELRPGDLAASLAGPLATRALGVVEAAWPVYKKVLGARDGKPAALVLHRDANEFRTLSRQVWPFDVDGFVGKDGAGHVLLSPEVKAPVLDSIGLPPASREALLRVAAELVARQVIADADAVDDHDWMCWILTMGALEAVTDPKREFGVDQGYEMRRSWIQHFHDGKSTRLDPVRLISTAPKNTDDWRWMLAYSALTAEVFAEAAPGWVKKLLAKPKPPRVIAADWPWRREAAVLSVCGDLHKAEARFAKVVRALATNWDSGDGQWARVGERLLLVADPKMLMLNKVPLPKGDYAITARVEFGPGVDEVQVWLTDAPQRLVLSLRPGDAVLTAYTMATKKWLGRTRYAPDQEWKAPFDLRIEVTAGLVRVAIDGAPRLECKREEADGPPVFGLSVSGGCAWIEAPRIDPLAAPAKK
ncbi:MAG: hypothetical protein K8J09_08335 [Planctomycetes bacterium]|nr:hypothetical protein [Planctomycetota bacterium]MCC7399356.1 hypothetical protein [Planctomycetota bacterium]